MGQKTETKIECKKRNKKDKIKKWKERKKLNER